MSDPHYVYNIHPVYGKPGHLVIEAGPTVEVQTTTSGYGEHRVVFNRAAAASQAFSRKFSKIDAALNAEIPRYQRYLGRPLLKTLFEGKHTKAKRDARIIEAVHRYGYSQRQVAESVTCTTRRLAAWPTSRNTRDKT